MSIVKNRQTEDLSATPIVENPRIDDSQIEDLAFSSIVEDPRIEDLSIKSYIEDHVMMSRRILSL
jgi:hypothetical protein